MKNIYALQPYEVGSKNAKSLALLIPAKVVKKYGIDTSTIFTLKTNESTKIVTLETLPNLLENWNKKTMSTEDGLETVQETS